ncbi:hypothetical protein HPB47_000442 [Ixodes persulcatus]|uniref:Uncharacterized protein n=1 Tax=Ixodes persulcatus TaxID=34615 RepID=A0AC60PRR2_IXOPE|nr:hypothetical protein HPB47_000442 [Ixodes persulcatus]
MDGKAYMTQKNMGWQNPAPEGANTTVSPSSMAFDWIIVSELELELLRRVLFRDLTSCFRKAVQLFKNVLRGAVDGRLTPGARAHQSMVQAATQIDREAQPVIKLVRPTKDAAYRLLKGGEFSPGELLRDALNLSNDHQGLRALLVVIDIISGDARNSSRVPPNPAPVPKKPRRPRKPVRNVG